MSVDTGISGSSSQVLIFPIGYVLVCTGVTILLGQTKVNDVDEVSLLAQTHQEVVWLHVSVDEVLGMDVFDSADLGGKSQTIGLLPVTEQRDNGIPGQGY